MGKGFSGGSWITAAAAVVALAVMVTLLAEIVRTERAQQELSEETLNDLAEVAAWQYAGWAEIQMQALIDMVFPFREESALEEPLDEVFALALERARDCPCPEGTRPGAAFRYDGEDLEFTGPSVVAERSGLGAHLERVAERNEPKRDFQEDIDFLTNGEGTLAVVATVHHQSEPVVTGYVARTKPLESMFENIYNQFELLPDSLVGERDKSELVGIQVVSEAGTLYETNDFGGPWQGHQQEGVSRFGDWRLGLTFDASLSPDASAVLLPGGPPESRVPLLAALAGIALMLGGVAAWQFRNQRRLVRMRADTVARISHELRTPLAQIRLFTDTLRLGRANDANQRERALAVIDRETRRLDHLVHNVLRFGAREQNKETLTPRELRLDRFLEEVAEEFRPLADHAGAQLETRIQGQARVMADAEALRRVLLNLLDNAAKYGPENGTILLTAETLEDGRVRICVEDEGPGIPESERERIWQMYDRPGDNGAPGSGIGLAVVRHYVTAHGGEARVETAASGGARFVLDLPAA